MATILSGGDEIKQASEDMLRDVEPVFQQCNMFPSTMHLNDYTHGSRFVRFCYGLQWSIISISFRITSLQLGQSHRYRDNIEGTLENDSQHIHKH